MVEANTVAAIVYSSQKAVGTGGREARCGADQIDIDGIMVGWWDCGWWETYLVEIVIQGAYGLQWVSLANEREGGRVSECTSRVL